MLTWLKVLIPSATLAAAVGCTEDPVYVQPVNAIEANASGAADPVGTATITLPIRAELTDEEMDERAQLVEDLGVTDADIPFVTSDDLDISIEWTVTNNNTDVAGEMRIDINGANEYVEYVPVLFVVDEEEMEEPPPLIGDVPISVEPGATISGVIREDQIYEADVDLELIGRANPALTPFAAMLAVHEDTEEFDLGGTPIPSQLFASMIRFTISLEATTNMVMLYTIRVRDHRTPDLIVKECLDEQEVLTPTLEECMALRQFAPVLIDPFGLGAMMP